MAAAPKKAKVQEDVEKQLEPMAKALKKTAEQLFRVYVKRYLAKGIAELFVGIVIAVLTLNKLWANHWVWWLCIPFPIIMLLALDAIQCIINPAYHAIGDVEDLIKRNKKGGSDVTIYNGNNRSY